MRDFLSNSTHAVYDLHTHTTASDGHLTPSELVTRAVERRVDVLAITDHDTVAGLIEAQETIKQQQLPLQLVNGLEVSTLWENHEIHIVGLGVDVAHPSLIQLLAEQTERRHQRAQAIGERLAKAHIPNALVGAKQWAKGDIITRKHFAHYLVQIGVANSLNQVFKNYLAKGKVGYVLPQWCTMEQAINVIHQSGGQAVLAHPRRYQLSTKWLKRLLTCFSQYGGDAMEIAQCQQPANERTLLASYAREYRLLASQGSDFHYPCAWIELGRNLWLPGNVDAVWQDWIINK